MPDPQVLERVASVYQARQIALAERAAAAVGRIWDQTAGLDDTAATRFADAASRFVAAAQAQASSLTSAYLTTYATLAAGEPVATPQVPAATVESTRGVAATTVYHRSIVAARVAVANGASFTDAMRTGRFRAVQTADTDTMLAARETAREVMARIPRIVGYRRQPDARACSFCLLASTQRYRVGELMPLHSHCHCSVVPIYGTSDPGHIIDRDLLGRLKAAGVKTKGGGGDRAALEQLYAERVAVHEHGELGPVLYDSRWVFDPAA